MTQQATILFVVVGCIIFVVGLALLYFGSRMQLVFTELVATRTTTIRPLWRKHGKETWPWIGLKVASLVAFFVVGGPIVALPLIYLFRHAALDGNKPQDPAFLGSFLLIFATIAAAVLLMMLAIWILRDVVLPFVVFKEATIGGALRSAATLLRAEPASFAFYFLMKFIFTLTAAVAAELCLLLAALAGAIPLGLVGGALWLALHQTGATGMFFLYIALGLLGLIFVLFMAIIGICVTGAVLTFYQAYSLYFMGGRIAALGDLLEPPPPLLLDTANSPLMPI